jgi:LysM repeat protein
MKKQINILLLLFLPILSIAQEQNSLVPSKLTVEQYIEKYAKYAVEEMYRSKIPASITLAQGILESGNGNSRLAVEGNNHFGIKCKSTWTGESIYEDDDAPNECFRKYKHAIESYQDHSEFLMRNSRYAFLFDLEPTNYVEWAKGLKRAGYATNPQYAELLITFIERHKLHKFDTEKPSGTEAEQIATIKIAEQKLFGKQIMVNGVPGLTAKEGQSYAEIAIDFDLKVFQIYRYNDLTKDAVCSAGDTVYLKQKKNKSESLVHIVSNGQTMHWIAQHYAIKLDKLLERNLMQDGQEPATGEFIQMNETRTTAPKLVKLEVTPPIEQIDTTQTKETYTALVTENPIQNIETSKPAPVSDISPVDSLHDFKENLSFFHTVQKGETLYGIGKKYGVRVDAIQFINALESDSIEVGQKLIINPEIKTADTKEPQRIPGIHKVRAGETLYAIANNYAMKLEDLMATNNLPNNQIQIGQILVVVPGVALDSNATSFYHTVQQGETLYSILRKYAKTKNELMELNPNLNDYLTEGQKIKIR